MVETEREIVEARRIRQFASFFKSYMGVSSFVVAALPIPVTMMKLIPIHQPDAGSLSVITSLTCFLILAFIFFSRHSLARTMFEPVIVMVGEGDEARETHSGRYTTRRIYHFDTLPRRIFTLPSLIALLIGLTLLLFLAYLVVIFHAEGRAPSDFDRILLIGFYAGFFTCAEAAFVLMATKEYLQDLMGISEIDLIDPMGSVPRIEPGMQKRARQPRRAVNLES